MSDLNVALIIEAIDKATLPLRKVAEGFRRSTGHIKRAMGDATSAAERFHKAMERATYLRVAADGAARVGEGFTNALRKPVGAAVEFESAMADVRKVVNFEAPDGLEQMGDELRNLSRTIPVSAKGLAEIAAAGGRFGLPADQIAAFTAQTAKVATAWEVLPEEAGESIARLSNVFQIPIESVGEFADAINYLADNAATTAPAVTNALLRMGGVTRMFGLAETTAAALATAMLDLGRPPEIAARAINTMLQKLQTADTQGKKFQAVLKHIGLNATELKQAISEDADGALLDLLTRLEQLDNATRVKALTFMFGEGFSDDIGILVGSLSTYRKQLNNVADEQNYLGKVQAEFAIRSQTTANGFVLLNNRMEAWRAKMGQALLPQINQLTESIGKVVDKMNVWVAEYPALTKALLIFAGVVGIALTAISKLLLLLAAMVIISGGLPKSILKVGGMFKKMGGGISKAGGALKKVGGLARGLLKPFGLLKPLFSSIGRLATQALGPVLKLLNPITKITAAFGAGYIGGQALYDKFLAGTAVSDAIGKGITGAVDAIDTSLAVVADAADAFGQGMNTAYDALGKGMTHVAAIFGNQQARETLAEVKAGHANQPPARVGGTLHIKIDAEGRPKIKKLEQQGEMDIDVATGPIMVMP